MNFEILPLLEHNSFVTKVRTFKIILILIILFYHCPVLLDDISVTGFV